MDQQHSPGEIRDLSRRRNRVAVCIDATVKSFDELTTSELAHMDMISSSKYDKFMTQCAIAERDLEINHTWEAGGTERCHTTPHHGSYDVGRHSYGALTLLLMFYPGDPSMRLVKAVLWHDAGEMFLGDLRGDAKWKNPALRCAYEEAETRTLNENFPTAAEAIASLTADEKNWLDAVDRLDLIMWTSAQYRLGNQSALDVNTRVLHQMKKKGNTTPQPILDFVTKNTRG